MGREGLVLSMIAVALVVGGGNDDIIAFEGGSKSDLVFCGAGRDTVYYQKGIDRLFDCERKYPV